MTSSTLSIVVTVLTILLLFAGLLFFVCVRLYKRSSDHFAMVRVGYGGPKVMLNGKGALCIPILQEVLIINMGSFRFPYACEGEQALVFRDNARFEAAAEFTLHVRPTKEGVFDAAQTLGSVMTRPDKLRQRLEDKCVGAMRTAAVDMDAETVRTDRRLFIQKVRQAAADALSENGVELESVECSRLEASEAA